LRRVTARIFSRRSIRRWCGSSATGLADRHSGAGASARETGIHIHRVSGDFSELLLKRSGYGFRAPAFGRPRNDEALNDDGRMSKM
jgi:hypothetical protein